MWSDELVIVFQFEQVFALQNFFVPREHGTHHEMGGVSVVQGKIERTENFLFLKCFFDNTVQEIAIEQHHVVTVHLHKLSLLLVHFHLAWFENVAIAPHLVEMLDGSEVTGVEIQGVHHSVYGIVLVEIESGIDDTDRTLGGGIEKELVGEFLIDSGNRH